MTDSSFAGTDFLVLLVAFALLAIGVLRWQVAIIAALVLTVFEGALRKWAFPEFGQWIYFAKDFLLLGAYAGFFGPRVVGHKALLFSHPANGLLAMLGLLAVLQLANPFLPNLGVGLFGIKAHLIYVPLMYLAPHLFRDTQTLRKCWTWYLILALVPLLLGIIQFWSPADSVLNRYAWEDELAPGVAVFGSMAKPRITGTFSYITGYTTYLTLIFLMGVSWVTFGRGKSVPWWLYGVLALVVANLVMTGSRGPILILGASAVALFALAWHAGGRSVRRLVLTGCVALPLTGLLVAGLFPEAQTAFVERIEGTEDLPTRLVGIVSNPVWALSEAGVIGYGVGSTHQARALLIPGEVTDALPPPAEGEWERIILEIGPLGFALTLLIRVLVASHLWRAFHAVHGTPLQPYLATAFLFTLLSIPGHLVFNHTASVFFWLLAGFGLMAREPARSRAAAARRATVGRSARLGEHAG